MDQKMIKNMQYVILVYDVEEKRVNKVMKICRKYLSHIQNSVFMGEMDATNYKLIKEELDKVLNKEKDYVLILFLENKKHYKKIEFGTSKRGQIEDNEEDFL